MTNQQKILIVEDDPYFRETLKIFLKTKGYGVVEAIDGKSAQSILMLETVDAIISDVRMPNMDGLELLKSLRTNNSQVPFILMTGFSDITEAQQAYNLGANGFIAKPFKPDELLYVLDACLVSVSSTSAATKSADEKALEYCAVGIDDFLSSTHLKMDIYIRLASEKYIKLAHKGDPISQEHIKIYKSKGVRQLYIRSDEFKDYVNFNVQFTEHVSKKQNVPPSLKLKLIKHAQEVMVQNVFVNGIDKERINESAALVKSTLCVISQERQVFDLLSSINEFTDHMYAHSLGVSAYSILIAQGMGWHSTPVLFKLSLAGLLHDIGKKEIPKDIIDKPRHQLSSKEIELLESHAFRSKEILSEIPSISGDIVQIVLQHHENNYGKGPLRLKANGIHPLAKVVALADKFTKLVVKNPNYPLYTPQEAIQKIIDDGPGEFDPVCLKSLKSAVKFEEKKAA